MAKITDLPSFDLSKLDLSKIDTSKLPTIDTERITGLVRDAAYVVIGATVLAVQQAQVRRRELTAEMNERFGTNKGQLDEVVSTVESRLGDLTARLETFEAKLDGAVDRLEERLPEQAGALLSQAHGAAKAARQQVRGILRSAS